MDNNKTRLIAPGIIFPFILITSLFLLWGLANNMTDTLLAAFKRIMSMSDSRTALMLFLLRNIRISQVYC